MVGVTGLGVACETLHAHNSPIIHRETAFLKSVCIAMILATMVSEIARPVMPLENHSAIQ
jgi:hypothetical protein